MANYREIKACRMSGSSHLVSVLNLGNQVLTGVFPTSRDAEVTSGPVELVWCPDSGLLQLRHSYDPREMYGHNYGYRSGLNQSMLKHLTEKVRYLERMVPLSRGDTVLDIGSNDATTLKAYRTPGIQRVGIDPVGSKFAQYYSDGIKLIPEFFSSISYRSVQSKPAKIVTTIAMFYDVEEPIKFAGEIESVLAEDGIWHSEQSYMPSMLRLNSFDTICHEHLEYYSLGVIKTIAEKAGFKIADVVMNAVNGGSFAVTVAKAGNRDVRVNEPVINWLLEQEERMGLSTPRPYREFEERVFRHREDLIRLVRGLNADGKRVLGYGASTKGNVVLQFCGFSERDIPAIADINADKFGCFTPGTEIPIISEREAHAMEPDYFLVLPWHFKAGIIEREGGYLANGGRMIFPFPEIEIV